MALRWDERVGPSSARENDETLLKSCTLSDVTEGRSNVINIEEHDPQLIDSMFLWLYTGKLSVNFHVEDDAKLFNDCVELWTTADFFQLNDLKTDILHRIEAKLRYMAGKVQKEYYRKQTRQAAFREFNNISLHGYRAGVEKAYSYDFHELRCAFAMFAYYTQFRVLDTKQFEEILDAVPGFAKDVVMSTLQALDEGFYIGTKIPHGFHEYNCEITRRR